MLISGFMTTTVFDTKIKEVGDKIPDFQTNLYPEKSMYFYMYFIVYICVEQYLLF